MKGNMKYNQVDNMSRSPIILVCLLSSNEREFVVPLIDS